MLGLVEYNMVQPTRLLSLGLLTTDILTADNVNCVQKSCYI